MSCSAASAPGFGAAGSMPSCARSSPSTAWKTESLMADGLDRQEAHRRAAIAVGNVTMYRESARGVWGFQALDSLVQDIRYGVRVLAKSPAFTGLPSPRSPWASAPAPPCSASPTRCCAHDRGSRIRRRWS